LTVWCGWQETIWAARAQEYSRTPTQTGVRSTQVSCTGNRSAMEIKDGTTAYQRKSKQRDVIVTIVIDDTALARVQGERAINNRSNKPRCCAVSSEVLWQVHKRTVRPGERWISRGVVTKLVARSRRVEPYWRANLGLLHCSIVRLR
jgi:hypothetical protein